MAFMLATAINVMVGATIVFAAPTFTVPAFAGIALLNVLVGIMLLVRKQNYYAFGVLTALLVPFLTCGGCFMLVFGSGYIY